MHVAVRRQGHPYTLSRCWLQMRHLTRLDTASSFGMPIASSLTQIRRLGVYISFLAAPTGEPNRSDLSTTHRHIAGASTT